MAKERAVQIPNFGKIVGLYDSDAHVTRFLGIPYGSVSVRWTKPSILHSLPNGSHDGRAYGPTCPQVYMPGTPSIQQLAVPSIPPNPEIKMEEHHCLNMNIVKPETEDKDLPIMVWIHGGGFAVGSHTETVYDGVEFVKESLAAKSPVIYVAIHYRVGYFGFLGSEKLQRDKGEAVGNYGLWDQRLAFQFINQHISAFGGDPKRITLFGESAGSASVHAHLVAGEPLFHQAICQSGVIRTVGPFRPQDPLMNQQYKSLAETLGLDVSVTPDNLRRASSEAIVKATAEISGGTLAAFFITDDTGLDGAFFPSNTDWVTNQPFCKRFMIGDCATEGIVMARCMARIPKPDLERLFSSTPTLPMEYLMKMGIIAVSATNSNYMSMESLVNLETELAFFGPTEEVIQSSSSESTYVYRFNRPNTWDAAALGNCAHHTIDLLYLAGAPYRFPTKEPDTDIALSKKMIRQWVDFAVGRDPWRPYGAEGWEMVYGVDGKFMETKRLEHHSRNFNNVVSISGPHAQAAGRINGVLSSGILNW